MNNEQKAERVAWGSLFINFIVAIVKGFAGYFGNSYALIADAIESITDVCSSFLVVLGFRYARRPPDENHPYGHGKVEPLVTFVVVVFLCIAASFIIVESIHLILTPHKSPASYTLWVLGGVIIVKEAVFRIITRYGKAIGSTSLVADAQHHRSDAITSLFAFVGISIALVLGDEYAAADDWAALVASLIIFYNAYRIFRPALGEIMDENLHEDFIARIQEVARRLNSIKCLEKCHVRKSGMRYWVDVHIHVDGHLTVDEGHTIAHELKAVLKAELPAIEDVLVHVEPA